MKAKIDVDSFRQKLAVFGLGKTQQEQVIELLMQGLDIQVNDIGEFAIEGNGIDIKLLNAKGELKGSKDPLQVNRFDCHIEGIDSNNIKSVTIPKLDYSSMAVLSLDIEYIPFSFTSFHL